MKILYLDIDTLRPDHLGCYGYHRDTSPNIDKIAEAGVMFTNYHCSDAPCLPSRTALHTGRFGIHTGVVGHGGTAADIRIEGQARGFKSQLEFESLPGVLSSYGLKTVSISPFAARHGSWSFYAGWDEMHNTGMGGMEGADDITPTALEWIENHAQEDNWFLHINYWDPHTPYRAPVEMGNPFSDDPLPDWITPEVLETHQNMVGAHKALNINMFSDKEDQFSQIVPEGAIKTPSKIENMEDLRQIFDGYDLGIRRADDHFGVILNALDEQGVLDDLIIIISSDHGENFGELGIYAEHGTADQITTRVPLIIRWPGMKSKSIDDGLHYNLDLLPTLAEMLDIDPTPPFAKKMGLKIDPNWDGKSFASALKTGEKCGRKYLVVSQCCHVCQRAVRFDKWIYIRTYHDGYHLFPDEMLFDLEADPHEQFDLAEKHPEICRQAVTYLNEWHDDMMRTMDSPIDPLWTVMQEGGPFHARGQLQKYCEFLEGTSREWAIAELKKRHPEEFS
jgi:arylsulfatase A-like enzyme